MKRFADYTMFVLSVGVAGYAFLFFRINANLQMVQKFMTYPLFAYSHIYGGAVAMLVAPIQFHLPNLLFAQVLIRGKRRPTPLVAT